MRLIDSSTKELVSFPYDADRPKYAILSHTWGPPDDEVLFDDMTAGRNCEWKTNLRQDTHDMSVVEKS